MVNLRRFTKFHTIWKDVKNFRPSVSLQLNRIKWCESFKFTRMDKEILQIYRESF